MNIPASGNEWAASLMNGIPDEECTNFSEQ